MIKNGTEHRRSLQDGREVYIEGARVHDVTTDRSFATIRCLDLPALRFPVGAAEP